MLVLDSVVSEELVRQIGLTEDELKAYEDMQLTAISVPLNCHG